MGRQEKTRYPGVYRMHRRDCTVRGEPCRCPPSYQVYVRLPGGERPRRHRPSLQAALEWREDAKSQIRAGTWKSPTQVKAERARAARDLDVLDRIEDECGELLREVRKTIGILHRTGVRARESNGTHLPRADRPIMARQAFRGLRAKRPPKLNSDAERLVYRRFTEQGWELLRSGWADFLGLSPQGAIVPIEVKGSGDRLRAEQQDMAAALHLAGLDTLVLWVTGDVVVPANLGEPGQSSA